MSAVDPHNLAETGEPQAGQFPRAALNRLWIVAAVLLAASAIPYVSSSFADYRYWSRLDASALLRAVTLQPPPKEAVVLAESGPPPDDGVELAENALNQLAGVGTDGQKPIVLPAIVTEAAVPVLAGEGTATAGAEILKVADDALGEQKVWLSGPPQALAPFFRALVDLANNKRPYVRIAHYGDSHTADDGITHVARQLLQRRFGDGGHGFTLVQGRTQWYSHKGIGRSASEGWHMVNFLNGNAKDGAYGYGGVASEGGPGEWFNLDSGKSKISKFILYFRAYGKAAVSARIDGKAAAALAVVAPAGVDAEKIWPVAEGTHSIQWLVTAGKIRLFGGAVERDRGVIYDSMGEVGARGTRWTLANAEHLKAVMAQRPPDLLILNYGGNERTDKISETKYLDQMGKVVERMRAGTQNADGSNRSACLILGPGDHGMREKGKIISEPDIIRINNWQKKLADSTGCAFFDAQAFMGGDGAMGRWVKQGLGWSDYSHFTGKGEQAMGVGLYRALLQGLREYVKR